MIGSTVTWLPSTVTLRKWITSAGELGGVAAPQALPVLELLDQPIAYASMARHGSSADGLRLRAATAGEVGDRAARIREVALVDVRVAVEGKLDVVLVEEALQ